MVSVKVVPGNLLSPWLLNISIVTSGALFFVILDPCFPTSKLENSLRDTPVTSLIKEVMDYFSKLFCF